MDDKKVAMARKLREDPNHSIEDICNILGVSKATFYRYLKTGEKTDAI